MCPQKPSGSLGEMRISWASGLSQEHIWDMVAARGKETSFEINYYF